MTMGCVQRPKPPCTSGSRPKLPYIPRRSRRSTRRSRRTPRQWPTLGASWRRTPRGWAWSMVEWSMRPSPARPAASSPLSARLFLNDRHCQRQADETLCPPCFSDQETSMTTIREDDFVSSIADALQYISYYHPPDFIKALGDAYAREQ